MIVNDPVAQALAGTAAGLGAVSVAQGATNVGTGFISSLQATMATINSSLGNVIGSINTGLAQVGNFLNKLKFLELIAFVVIIGKCLFKFLTFIIEFGLWIFDFLQWLVLPWPSGLMNPGKKDSTMEAGFFPWLIRFTMTTVYKIVNFPKCFLWYALDTAGWIMYLPFRFIFWLFDSILDIGIVKGEHDVWCFLDDIDYFLHGPIDNEFLEQYEDSATIMRMNEAKQTDPDSMNLGFHLIHFPDTVMRTCYQVNNYSLKSLKSFPMKSFLAFMKCAMSPF